MGQKLGHTHRKVLRQSFLNIHLISHWQVPSTLGT